MKIRGLYVVRSGGAPALTEPTVARDEQGQDAAREEPDDGRLGTLQVAFSQFDTWYEIDSVFEGRFLERTVRGAFKRTISQRGKQVRVMFNHGYDPSLGERLISYPEVIEERDDGPYLEGPLLRGTPELIVEGLRAGLYGSSFMFEVLNDEWNDEPKRSDHNPEGLPERTITEVRLHEAGPVTWPANPDATAGVRCGTDWMLEQLQQRDAERADDLVRSFSVFRAAHGLRAPSDEGTATPQAAHPEAPAPGSEPARHVDGITAAQRNARLRALRLDELARSHA